MKLKQDTSVTRATRALSGHPVPVAISSYLDHSVWVYSHDAYGSPAMIIQADTFEDAYETMLDESREISEEEVPEAHGMTTEEWEALIAASDDGQDVEWPELSEGYQYQPNARTTGIINVGHYESLTPWTKDCGVRLWIRHDDFETIVLGGPVLGN